MARRNFYVNNPQDPTLPPEPYKHPDSIVDKTLPEDDDPTRNDKTQPDDVDVTFPPVSPENQTNYGKKPVRNTPSRVINTIPFPEPTEIDDELKTEQVPRSNKLRNRRVVAWMVGVQGICKGVDYRLHEGKNYIGRDKNCEVEVNDRKVSAGRVAQVVFDPRSKRFFSSDCDGTSTICYQNGEPLLGRTELKRYDSIELGDSKLLFIPLCGEEFTWEEEEKNQE